MNEGTLHERPSREDGQADQSGDVSSRGRSSHSSPSTGKPCTRQRGAAREDSTKPQGKAMYVATSPDKDWLLTEQRKLYARSYEDPVYVFRKLWGVDHGSSESSNRLRASRE